MNPSFCTTIEDLMNEINQINSEIYPTNLHITEFYKIKTKIDLIISAAQFILK